MSFSRNAALFALAFFSTAGILVGGEPTPGDIANAVRQLGDDNFVVREKASMLLWKAGRAAEPALHGALKSADLEVQRRARALLDHFEYGIYRDTPKNIVELAQQFRAGNPSSRLATLQKLLALDSPGYAVVVRIAAAEKEPQIRSAYYEVLRKETPRLARVLLSQGNLDAVSDMLELATRHRAARSSVDSPDSPLRDYAAFLLLRGTLDKKIAQVVAQPELAREPRTAEVLAYLYRAKGDLPSAFRAAEQSGDRELQRWLLWEQSKWADLLDRHPPRTDMKGNTIEILGFQAAFQRLAGRTKDFQATVGEIRRYSEDQKGDSSEIWFSAEALFLNDRPQDAIDVMIQAKRYGMAFEYLKYQMRIREALALADKVKGENHKDAFLLEVRRACTLYEVGEKEKALPLLVKFRDAIKTSKEENWVLEHLVATEYKLGLKDLAFEHAGLILARPNYGNPGYLFYQLVGDKGHSADFWWAYLRHKFPAEDRQATVKRLRPIMEGTLDRKELLTLVVTAANWVQEPRTSENQQRERWLQTLGETCLAAGLEKEGIRYLKDANGVADGATPLLRLADYHAEKKQWQQGAALYGKAWEKDKRALVPLFLQGWALVQAGQKQEGEKLMKLAHWLPLANGEARYLLTEAMTKRGLNDLALREREVTARVGDMPDWYTGTALSSQGSAAADKGRFLESAARRELGMLRCLNCNTGFLESSSYLDVPHNVHQTRARGLLAAGKIEDALQEIQICLAFHPADVETPVLFVPLLEKSGRKQAADDLFAKVFKHREQLCADYPRWAQAHNELAWLCARCRRQLDKALTYATKAVALDPKSVAYLDTLAEVHFQRGDQAKAIEVVRRCLELAPQRDFYRRQLKRYETGDRLADLPSGASLQK